MATDLVKASPEKLIPMDRVRADADAVAYRVGKLLLDAEAVVTTPDPLKARKVLVVARALSVAMRAYSDPGALLLETRVMLELRALLTEAGA